MPVRTCASICSTAFFDQRRRHELEHQRLRGTLDQAAEQATVAAGRGGLRASPTSRGCTSISKRAVRGPGARSLVRSTRVDREVPGVDPVALEQHDRVLARRHVDVDLHRALAVGHGLVEVLGLARGQVDPVDEAHLALLECADQGVGGDGVLTCAQISLSRGRPDCCTAYDVGAVTRTVPFPKLDGMRTPLRSTGTCQPRAATRRGDTPGASGLGQQRPTGATRPVVEERAKRASRHRHRRSSPQIASAS